MEGTNILQGSTRNHSLDSGGVWNKQTTVVHQSMISSKIVFYISERLPECTVPYQTQQFLKGQRKDRIKSLSTEVIAYGSRGEVS